MSTTITSSALEPTNSLTAPTPGEDTNTWGDILNEDTFPTLLGYILWLKANTGADGREVELQADETHIQWRYEGDEEWTNLVALADLTGPAGSDGADGEDGASAYEVAVAEGFEGDEEAWLASLVGEKGDAGDQGPAGVGVPEGGTTGQVLKKKTAADYDTEWANESGGGGASGIVVVKHGANASETRPTADAVYWLGSVAPNNKATGDLWLETGAFD